MPGLVIASSGDRHRTLHVKSMASIYAVIVEEFGAVSVWRSESNAILGAKYDRGYVQEIKPEEFENFWFVNPGLELGS